MDRRDILKLLFGSLASSVVPVKSLSAVNQKSDLFVNMCNIAISHEYGAIVQYINHAGHIDNKKVQTVLLSNMHDEVYHARMITKFLVKEGATPTVSVWPPQTGKTLQQLLEEDINGETAAIKLYQKILDLPESKRYRDSFYNFLKREEVHRSRLTELLNAIKSG